MGSTLRKQLASESTTRWYIVVNIKQMLPMRRSDFVVPIIIMDNVAMAPQRPQEHPKFVNLKNLSGLDYFLR
jgi:hypothetical protein